MYKYLDQMNAEVCAYLTGNKYFELPAYRVRNCFFLLNKFLIIIFTETFGEFYPYFLFGCFLWHVFGWDWCCYTFRLEV
jgi:hypothetical protein